MVLKYEKGDTFTTPSADCVDTNAIGRGTTEGHSRVGVLCVPVVIQSREREESRSGTGHERRITSLRRGKTSELAILGHAHSRGM